MMRKFIGTLLFATTALALGACSATPDKPSDAQPGVVYNKPIADVQKAALNALASNGFEITKSGADYVEGSRPHKMGLLVGSGGETAGVWLTAVSATSTSVKVDTAKSFAGMAGQKSWDTEIIAAMDSNVGPHH